MRYDPEMILFGKYKLKDLTTTQTGLDNQPDSDYQIANLRWLAKVLEQLEASIGPFAVLSAFRSHDTQEAVGPGAVAEGKLSFHEVGMAADIGPLTMTIEDYISKIMNSEWRSKLGEIIFKKDQNALHIGLPSKKYRGVFKIRENGSYRMMTQNEIKGLEDIMKASYAPVSYASNDADFIQNDPSEGALFSDLFLGMFGVYAVGSSSADLPELENHDPENEYDDTSFGMKMAKVLGLGSIVGFLGYIFLRKKSF